MTGRQRRHRCDHRPGAPGREASSLRSDGPMDADGLRKSVDGYEVQHERTRPPLPASPWKSGTRTPAFHKRPQAASPRSVHPAGTLQLPIA
jgi:hypothetical protein